MRAGDLRGFTSVAQEHAARDPAIVPGSEAHSLVEEWQSAVARGTWSARLESASDAEGEYRTDRIPIQHSTVLPSCS